MVRHLLITIRLHDGQYHGADEGPAAPARLFQALVAGAGLGGPRCLESFEPALRWLEALDPPIVASPALVNGQTVRLYVPNNDLDALGGDPRRIGKIRTLKVVRPQLLSGADPWLYVWRYCDSEEARQMVDSICRLAERLYQFGRGVDMAWAWAEVADADTLEARLREHRGPIYRPALGNGGIGLACPRPGTFQSLKERHAAGRRRFSADGSGRLVFTQQPKPQFRQVFYESPPARCVFTLVGEAPEAGFSAWPLAHVSRLVVALRDGAIERLKHALPSEAATIERVLVGRKPDGSNSMPSSSRVRIIPLPSIGHHHADRRVRRVLIEVPGECPLRADDVFWAFSGLEIPELEPKDADVLMLTVAAEDRMLVHYGVDSDGGGSLWRTVTAAALPVPLGRRDRGRVPGPARTAELKLATTAVVQALRHAGVSVPPISVRTQREPFSGKGDHASSFATGTRFAAGQMWHLEIRFAEGLAGPLVIGNGRFMGLGVMAPVRESHDVYAFAIEAGVEEGAEIADLTQALRRATMARVQAFLGPRASLPPFFSGHAPDGLPARTEESPHVACVFDPVRMRLLILPPHALERRRPTRQELRHLRDLEVALRAFRELRAGSAGRLHLRAVTVDTDSDPLFRAARVWESITTYQVTRHIKRVTAAEALVADLEKECRRRGLPTPRVSVFETRGVSGAGLTGRVRLTFEVAVAGPIVLGRTRHSGGGLFAGGKTERVTTLDTGTVDDPK